MANPFNKQKISKAMAESKRKAKAKTDARRKAMSKLLKLNPNPLTTPDAVHKKYANVLK